MGSGPGAEGRAQSDAGGGARGMHLAADVKENTIFIFNGYYFDRLPGKKLLLL